MAVTLVGEVVNSADATTGFNVGNISGDDDFVEGTGALGLKASATTVELFTTSLGATAPYNFSSGGGEEGDHMIIWFNTKTPINPTTGLTIIVGNETDRGRWNVLGSGFYKGGFVTRVIDPSRDFDLIAAGTWSLTGNPAQLSNITEMGGGFTTTTSIMGSFNNVQIDQMTIGTGVRVDGGTVGVPNTFETIRAQDQDVSFWGWWSSAVGAIVGKGKCYIGPETGSATSVFNHGNFTLLFADELVADGFYEILVRGAATDVDWFFPSIRTATSTSARWSVTVDSTTNRFADHDGVWFRPDIVTLNANSTLFRTTIVRGNKILQNGATIVGMDAFSTGSPINTGFLVTDDLDLTTESFFDSDGTGHAIELTSLGSGSMGWDNRLRDYAASDGSTGNEAIWVNVSSGTLTINVASGADTPSIRTAGAVVSVVAGLSTLAFTLDPSIIDYEYRIYEVTARGSLDGAVEVAGQETATVDNQSYLYTHVGGKVLAVQIIPQPDNEFEEKIEYFDSSASDQIVIIGLEVEENA